MTSPTSIGQAFAARSGWPRLGSAEGWPTRPDVPAQAQQCSAGFFRLNFSPDKTEAGAEGCERGHGRRPVGPPDTGRHRARGASSLQRAAPADPARATPPLGNGAVDWLLRRPEDRTAALGGGHQHGRASNANSTGLGRPGAGRQRAQAAPAVARRLTWVARPAESAATAPATARARGWPTRPGAIAYDPGRRSTSRARPTASSADDAGLPVWVGPVAVGGLLGVAGVATYLRRRTS